MGHMEWDHNGRAKWRQRSTVPCPGPPGHGGCIGRYEDDYGSTKWCPTCTYGDGQQVVITWTPCPQFDAPRPPKGWTPERSAEEQIDAIYGGV
jgi:hypothetical protein